MYKKKGRVRPKDDGEVKAYTPKPDNKIYIIVQRTKNKLTPVPYTHKQTYNYIKNLLQDGRV